MPQRMAEIKEMELDSRLLSILPRRDPHKGAIRTCAEPEGPVAFQDFSDQALWFSRFPLRWVTPADTSWHVTFASSDNGTDCRTARRPLPRDNKPQGVLQICLGDLPGD